MKTFNFDFNLEAWVKNLQIEAETKEEAIKKLKEMSLSEIAENGVEKNLEITDIDSKLIEADYTIEVNDIVYELNEVDAEMAHCSIKELQAKLPKTLTINIHWSAEYDIEDSIDEEIDYQTKYMPFSYRYKILNK